MRFIIVASLQNGISGKLRLLGFQLMGWGEWVRCRRANIEISTELMEFVFHPSTHSTRKFLFKTIKKKIKSNEKIVGKKVAESRGPCFFNLLCY